MVFIKYRVASAVAFLLMIQLDVIQCFGSGILNQVTDTVNSILSNGVMPTLQNRATRPLDKLKTVCFKKKKKKKKSEICLTKIIENLNIFG